MDLSPALMRLLGPAGSRELELVDATRRPTIRAALETCAIALEKIDRLDLSPWELSEVGTADLSIWGGIAGDVRNVLLTVQNALSELGLLFPPANRPPEVATEDLTIEDMFGGTEHSTWDEDDLDSVVKNAIGSTHDEMAGAVATLATMLHYDVVSFGEQLRRPDVVGDRWSLLGVVQEFRTSCQQCLEAVVAAIFSSVTQRDLDKLIPRYRAAAGRTVELRRMLVALSYDVGTLNLALQHGSADDAPAITAALEERLDAFMNSPKGKLIRASDKRLVVLLRVYLRDWDRRDIIGLKSHVDDVSKSLELLRDINQREVLKKHDAEALDAAIALLEVNAPLADALPFIEKAYGRSLILDERLFHWRAGRDQASRDALEVLRGVRKTLPKA